MDNKPITDEELQSLLNELDRDVEGSYVAGADYTSAQERTARKLIAHYQATNELKPCPFTFPEKAVGTFDVIYSNGKVVGELYQEVHGEYVYVPSSYNGYWPEWGLRAIADKLAELNTRTGES